MPSNIFILSAKGNTLSTSPDSKLNQTLDRSDFAHNEYLQVSIDHGLIGLALMLWVLGEVAWRGWKRRKELPEPDRLLHDAFGWSALGFALQALVDFPFHVPPIALTGIICLAAWGSHRPAADRATDVTPEGDAFEGDPTDELAGVGPIFRPWAFFRLLSALVLLGLVPLISLPLVMIFQSDVSSVLGNAYVTSYYQMPEPADDSPQASRANLVQKVNLLRKAVKHLNLAVQVPHPMASLQLGEAYNEWGWLYATQTERDAQGRRRRPLADEAVRIFEQGLRQLTKAEAGLNIYNLYLTKAHIYRALGLLMPNSGHESRYHENLIRTMHLCPAFKDAAEELAESLDASSAPAQELTRLRQELLRTHPTVFNDHYIARANDSIKEKRYRAAARIWEQILACDPERADWIASTALARMMAGERERALELLKTLRSRPGIELYSTGGSITEAALERNWAQLLVEFKHILPPAPAQRAECRALELEAQRHTGRLAEPSHFPCPKNMTEQEWKILVAETRPAILLHYLNDPQAARQAMGERLKEAGEASADFWIEGIYTGLALGDRVFAGDCLTKAVARDPGHPALAELRSDLERTSKKP